MIIDLHCDTILKLWRGQPKVKLKTNQYCVDVDKMKIAGSLAQFFAVFIDLADHDRPYSAFTAMADLFMSELEENSDRLALATTSSELERNWQDGKVSCFLTIEEGGVLEGQLSNLYTAYDRGVRLITLTWNYPNELGFPNYEWTYCKQGLTEFGRNVVVEMNRLGMLVDVSHLSDQGVYDVAAIAKRPFIASHSNARAVVNHSRNLTDPMIKLIADAGGVIGLNFCAEFLGTDPQAQIDDMIRHLRYLQQVGGQEVIALGTDFDGISCAIEVEDISQIHKLLTRLEQAGFKSSEIERFCWQNAARVLKDGIG